MKSYRVYRELEEAYNRVKAERDQLEIQLRSKETIIRSLAAELAEAPVRLAERLGTSVPTDIDARSETLSEGHQEPAKPTQIPEPRRSETVPKPGLPKGVPLSKIMGR